MREWYVTDSGRVVDGATLVREAETPRHGPFPTRALAEDCRARLHGVSLRASQRVAFSDMVRAVRNEARTARRTA